MSNVSNPQSLLEPPYNYVAYGPLTNCTLAVCPVVLSVYEYRPTLPGNAVFLALFGIALAIHLAQGFIWRAWAFMFCMACGCISEMLGYGGRIMLYKNPFTFTGFLLQIICITIAPVFYTAAIYLTLARIVLYLGPQYARFPAKFYYWIFIPCDILSLVLQSVGGALSSTSSGGSGPAIDISIAGLSFQVLTLCVFIGLSLEFAWRYTRAKDARIDKGTLPRSFKIFVAFLSAAVVFILIRCAYRIAELKNGYSGALLHDEGSFIALEGVMIIVACFCLNVAHPGPIFPREVGSGAGITEDSKA